MKWPSSLQELSRFDCSQLVETKRNAIQFFGVFGKLLQNYVRWSFILSVNYDYSLSGSVFKSNWLINSCSCDTSVSNATYYVNLTSEWRHATVIMSVGVVNQRPVRLFHKLTEFNFTLANSKERCCLRLFHTYVMWTEFLVTRNQAHITKPKGLGQEPLVMNKTLRFCLTCLFAVYSVTKKNTS